MGILFVVLLSAGCTGAFSGIQNTVPATPVSSGPETNQTPDDNPFDHQITMQVVMVDENAHAEYATVWLTPSERIYKLAKNIPDYRTYIALMEQSRKDGSLLTFTLDTQDISIIRSVVKGVQPASSSNEEKAVQVAQPVSSPDGVNPATPLVNDRIFPAPWEWKPVQKSPCRRKIPAEYPPGRLPGTRPDPESGGGVASQPPSRFFWNAGNPPGRVRVGWGRADPGPDWERAVVNLWY